MGVFTKSILTQIEAVSDFSIEEMEVDKDHIHLMITISPKYSIAQHVRNIKQMTNSFIWREFPQLKNQFWKEKTFWSDGYFVCSVGDASSETIRKYIREQG